MLELQIVKGHLISQNKKKEAHIHKINLREPQIPNLFNIDMYIYNIPEKQPGSDTKICLTFFYLVHLPVYMRADSGYRNPSASSVKESTKSSSILSPKSLPLNLFLTNIVSRTGNW
jgi:hypothetical protein